MHMTINEVIETCTKAYLDKLDPLNPPSPRDIEKALVNNVKDVCMLDNQVRPKGDVLKPPTKLVPRQIAMIMLKLHHIARVKSGGSDPDDNLLTIYQPDGEHEGIYVTDDRIFKQIASQYNFTITGRELDEVMDILKTLAPEKERATDRDLIAVNNGIFNFKAKVLEPFTPDRIFLAKSKVNYDPNAQNVTIHNDEDGTDWDVDSWMNELSDDPEVVHLLWEILSAIIRPHVRWNKSAWFYANKGNNGKGTLCELMRSLCGDGSYADIPLCDFSKDFALEPLVRSNAIIVDENDVGTFTDKAGNLKAIITNDVVVINRKFKTPISYLFHGFMVQCVNELPRFKDRSDSFYRRLLIIPFDKCFTGRERKYIKNDYLHRSEVLEYVLWRVLNMNFYTLSEPLSCRQALEEYKDFNDPVRQFVEEMLPQLKWDLAPFIFLYDLYKAWFRKNNPNGSILGKNKFTDDLLGILGPASGWYCPGKNVKVRPGKKMDAPEPLINEYNLGDWMSKTYIGSDPDRIARPTLKSMYHGLLRCDVQSDDD